MALVDSSLNVYGRLLRVVALLCLLTLGHLVLTFYQKRSRFRNLIEKHGIVSETSP